jgi:hypothetical protein
MASLFVVTKIVSAAEGEYSNPMQQEITVVTANRTVLPMTYRTEPRPDLYTHYFIKRCDEPSCLAPVSTAECETPLSDQFTDGVTFQGAPHTVWYTNSVVCKTSDKPAANYYQFCIKQETSPPSELSCTNSLDRQIMGFHGRIPSPNEPPGGIYPARATLVLERKTDLSFIWAPQTGQ